jgi:wyosine [tRNA(Phe)-imidazoG37] synthetase (radical SAM superfamily)
MAELTDYLANAPALDVITLTGSGEPLLNSAVGEIITAIKTRWPHIKTALLTNGTLLQDPAIRQSIMALDYVLPSLDAVSPDVFNKINQPHAALDNNAVIQGIIDFAHEYKGALWLEVFILPGINDTSAELARFKEVITRINPARVQLNALDRPAAYAGVAEASQERLEQIAAFMAPLPVEIIARHYKPQIRTDTRQSLTESILATLKRRPCTIEDLAATTGENINTLRVTLGTLQQEQHLKTASVGGRLFYTTGA